MSIQGFRGNCDSQASWGCAPALPNRIREIFLEVRFLITSRRQTKSFSVQQFFKNAAEVWASSPRLRSKLYLQHAGRQKQGWNPLLPDAENRFL